MTPPSADFRATWALECIAGQGMRVDYAIAVAERRTRIEVDLLAAILGDPARAIVAAESVGVGKDIIDQPDLRLMFIAADVCRRHPRRMTLRVAWRLLTQYGHTDPTNLATSETMRWSPAGFARFAGRFSEIQSPLCAHEAALQGRALVELTNAIRDAREYTRHANAILEAVAA